MLIVVFECLSWCKKISAAFSVVRDSEMQILIVSEILSMFFIN